MYGETRTTDTDHHVGRKDDHSVAKMLLPLLLGLLIGWGANELTDRDDTNVNRSATGTSSR